MKEQSVVFRCDRCGATAKLGADDPHGYPDDWRGADVLDRAMDLCADCARELQEWIDKAPPALEPDPARRFALFFSGLPHERKLDFIRTALRGDYRLEREPKGEAEG